MEKRLDVPDEGDKLDRCRRVLQQGLSLNPTDAKLLQVLYLLCHFLLHITITSQGCPGIIHL